MAWGGASPPTSTTSPPGGAVQGVWGEGRGISEGGEAEGGGEEKGEFWNFYYKLISYYLNNNCINCSYSEGWVDQKKIW